MGVVADDKYETELTKMADSATNKGVNEVSAGVKNMDDEFTKDENGVSKPAENSGVPKTATGKNTNKNAKRNAARKSKKKARQNKKKGRR